MKVAICIVTYRRPVGLARLLRGLKDLTFQAGAQPEIEVLVVDNDPEMSAAAVCDEMQQDYRWTLRYEHEPNRGISQARNRALICATGAADYISFIDDDEVPEPAWLAELLQVQHWFSADVVTGPVLPYYETRVPHWVVHGRFFHRNRYSTGSRLPHAGTCNVLIHSRVFRKNSFFFDERLGLVGGEDTDFFLRVSESGYKIVWADEAVVHEWIPETRARVTWLLQRAYRAGNSWSICEQKLRPSLVTKTTRVTKGLARICQGIIMLPFAFFANRAAVVNSCRMICMGAGNITGVAGIRYHEYKKVHGQ